MSIVTAESWQNFRFHPRKAIEQLILDELEQVSQIVNQDIPLNAPDIKIKNLDIKESKELSKLL